MYLTHFRIAWTAALTGFIALAVFSSNGAQFYNQWASTNFASFPTQSGLYDDPDGDGQSNIVEFAFGTDPQTPDSGIITPVFGEPDGTNGSFTVEILERQGHKSGVQIDLYLSGDLFDWFRPWWLRTNAASALSDPPDSVRERFTTILPGTNTWFVRAGVKLVEAGPETAKYYVATNGSDSNAGTNIALPFKTLTNATSRAIPGDLIYMRGGTYSLTNRIQISRNGNSTNTIRLRAYPGEHPVMDFSVQVFTNNNRGIELSASWWRIYGLEIFGAGDNGMNITGHSNVVELCVFHDCDDTGLQMSSPASANLVLNCDSYRNFDTGTVSNGVPTPGENADGFAPKLAGLGPNNVFRGCRAWENADDGWDMFAAPNSVRIESCWSFRNGSNVVNSPNYNGDGNGFKVGGTGGGATHYLSNCVSFRNTHHGYDQNNNDHGQTLDNNTAWANGLNSGNNINMNHGTVTVGAHLLRNNLSIAGTVNLNATTVAISNSWQVVTSPAAGTSDVLSTDESYALFPRRDDGGLPETPFLRPVPNGRLMDRGTNYGGAFIGSAPDLGAFETPQW